MHPEQPHSVEVPQKTVEAPVEPVHPPTFEAVRSPAEAPPPIEKVPFEPPVPAEDFQAPWREELSGRVEDFRRRRARLRRGFDASRTLDLDFKTNEESPADEIDLHMGGPASEFAEAERRLGPLAGHAGSERAMLDSMPLEKAAGGIRVLSGAAVQAGELTLGHAEAAPEPVEIILDSGRASGRQTEPETFTPAEPRALIGRRFLAGLVDAGVLLLGGAVFGAIFRYVAARGGVVSARPTNIVALGSVVAFLVLFYFGMSVALAASTPGLAMMGLEIRTLDGNIPSTRESLWRAFGYLVSASALFLGFVWAIFDSDGLTWHDLMSGTYVTEIRR